MRLLADQKPLRLNGKWLQWWNLLFWCPTFVLLLIAAIAEIYSPLNQLDAVDLAIVPAVAMVGCGMISILAPNRILRKIELGCTALAGIVIQLILVTVIVGVLTLCFHVFRP